MITFGKISLGSPNLKRSSCFGLLFAFLTMWLTSAQAQNAQEIPILRLAGTDENTYKELLKLKEAKDSLLKNYDNGRKFDAYDLVRSQLNTNIKFYGPEFPIPIIKYAKKINLLNETKINIFKRLTGNGPPNIKEKILGAVSNENITKRDADLFLDYLRIIATLRAVELDRLVPLKGLKAYRFPFPITPTFPPLQKYISSLYINQFGVEKPQDPSFWVVNLPLKKIGCTGFFISPRVMLTAAHCLQRHRKFYLTVNFDKINIQCKPHPRYRSRGFFRQLDYGLCYLSKDFPRLVILRKTKEEKEKEKKITELPKKLSIAEEWKIAKAQFERLSINPQDLRFQFRHRREKWILMGGYGCIERDGSGGRDGKYRAGYSRITYNSYHRLVMGSFHRADSGVLCAGDSGGAAFRLDEEFNPFGPRKVIAINSANTFRNGRIQNLSFLAKTSNPWFRRFLKQWRKKWNNPKVCGLDKEIDEICHE